VTRWSCGCFRPKKRHTTAFQSGLQRRRYVTRNRSRSDNVLLFITDPSSLCYLIRCCLWLGLDNVAALRRARLVLGWVTYGVDLAGILGETHGELCRVWWGMRRVVPSPADYGVWRSVMRHASARSGAEPRSKTDFDVFWRPLNAPFCTYMTKSEGTICISVHLLQILGDLYDTRIKVEMFLRLNLQRTLDQTINSKAEEGGSGVDDQKRWLVLRGRCSAFLWRYEPVRRTGKSDDWITFFSLA